MVDEAPARGKDLAGDMVKRLKRDILVAQNRLDAMQSHPRSDRARESSQPPPAARATE